MSIDPLKIAFALVQPLTVTLFLALLAALISHWFLRALAIVACLLCYAISTPLVAQHIAGTLSDRYPPQPVAQYGTTQAIVLLGGGVVAAGDDPGLRPGRAGAVRGLRGPRSRSLQPLLALAPEHQPWSGPLASVPGRGLHGGREPADAPRERRRGLAPPALSGAVVPHEQQPRQRLATAAPRGWAGVPVGLVPLPEVAGLLRGGGRYGVPGVYERGAVLGGASGGEGQSVNFTRITCTRCGADCRRVMRYCNRCGAGWTAYVHSGRPCRREDAGHSCTVGPVVMAGEPPRAKEGA